MKRIQLIAIFVGLATISIFTTDGSAYYDPGTGRFLSRDPGPSSGGFPPRDPAAHYHDGMNLYEYVQSQPTIGLDPKGTRVIYGDYYHKSDYVKTFRSGRSADKTMQAVTSYGEFQEYRKWKSAGKQTTSQRLISYLSDSPLGGI